MTRDDIIKLARKAGFTDSNAHSDIIVRHSSGAWISVHDLLERFHALAVAAEREACIAAVKSVKTSFEAQDRIVLDAVQAIRARSNT